MLEDIKKKRLCSIAGCCKIHDSHGYCNMHYMRLKRTGITGLNPIQRKDKHPLYNTWESMRQRCNNKNHSSFNNYGGRGITVCKEWDSSFESFVEDMGFRPFKKAELDRIDNNKGYYKENCRWTSKTENIRNCRATKMTKELVLKLREEFLTEKNTKVLSKKYGISRRHTNQILNGRSWSNLK